MRRAVIKYQSFMNSAKAPQLIFFGLIALLVSSCGNYAGGARGIRISSNGISYGATADLSGLSGIGNTTEGNYTCPNSANVLPNGDSNYDSKGKYTVCTNASNQANILIHGKTRASSGFCLFPIQYIDSTHAFYKPDLTTGLPLANCVTIDSSNSSNGVEMSFANITFNAAFIVDDTDKDQMQLCLANANSSACPLYSYGKFR
jgi:hypothetical protein